MCDCPPSPNSTRAAGDHPMSIIRRIPCLFGIHNWWGAGGNEHVCLECGASRDDVTVLSCPSCGAFHVLFGGRRQWTNCLPPLSFTCVECASLMEEARSIAEACEV